MKIKQPLVSVILVNWNGKKFLKPCMDSILNQTYKNFNVIFVDNASSDDSIQFLKTEYKTDIKTEKLLIVSNDKNHGFAEGNNIGIRFAFTNPTLKYIVALNVDTISEKDWLEKLVETAEQHKNAGMVQGKILREDKTTIDSTGLLFYRSATWLDRGDNEIDRGQYDKPDEIFGVCAAAALYSRAMLESLKPTGEFFDTDFFGYCEDVDISIRARLLGWCGFYTPNAIVYHCRGGTTGPESNFQIYHVQRNNLMLIFKSLPLGFVLKNLPFILTSQIGWLFVAMRKKPLVALKAKFGAIRNIRKMFKKRHLIMKNRKVKSLNPIEKKIFPPRIRNSLKS